MQIREKMAKVLAIAKKHMPTTRRGKILVYSILGFMMLMFVMSLSIAVWSAHPSFCRNCHHMEAFYDSWAASPHAKAEDGADCLACHAEPGLISYVKVKLNGLLEVVKTAVGAVPTKLRAAVPDATCLRSGCHVKEELASETLQFGKVRFEHKEHFDEVRGIKLRCASCHAASLHSADGTVSQRTCYTCHFTLAVKEPVAAGGTEAHDTRKCESCHTIPESVTLKDGTSFKHAEYAKDDSACQRCHGETIVGAGGVRKDQCVTCHNENQHHLEKYDDVEFVHETHVTDEQVACFECHDEIVHGHKPTVAAEAGNCTACHEEGHSPVSALYAGIDAGGAAAMPDPMFASSVQCAGCHVAPHAQGGEAASGALARQACVKCHEEGYDRMAGWWKSGFDKYLSELSAAREKAVPMAKGNAAAAALATATREIDFIRNGHAVHNVRVADRRLRTAQEALGKILGAKAMALPSIEKEAATCAAICHLGVDTIGSLDYAKSEFPHDSHVLSAQVKCSQCHKMADLGTDGHGETIPKGAGDCLSCHHGKEENCASCHGFQQAVFLGKVEGDPRSKPSPMAKEVACEACHKGISKGHKLAQVRSECVACHKGNEAYGKMLDEWQGVLGKEFKRLELLVNKAEGILAQPAGIPRPLYASLGRAAVSGRQVLTFANQDGSGGAHNLDYFDVVVTEALEELDRAISAIGR